MKMSLTMVGGSAESTVVNSVVGLNVVVNSKSLSGSVAVLLSSSSVVVVMEFIVGSLVSPSSSKSVKLSMINTYSRQALFFDTFSWLKMPLKVS